jgi:hypothetical protein
MWPFRNKNEAVVRHAKSFEIRGYQVVISYSPGPQANSVGSSVSAYIPTVGLVTTAIRADANPDKGLPPTKELRKVADAMATLCDEVLKSKFSEKSVHQMVLDGLSGKTQDEVKALSNARLQKELGARGVVLLPSTGYSVQSVMESSGLRVASPQPQAGSAAAEAPAAPPPASTFNKKLH